MIELSTTINFQMLSLWQTSKPYGQLRIISTSLSRVLRTNSSPISCPGITANSSIPRGLLLPESVEMNDFFSNRQNRRRASRSRKSKQRPPKRRDGSERTLIFWDKPLRTAGRQSNSNSLKRIRNSGSLQVRGQHHPSKANCILTQRRIKAQVRFLISLASSTRTAEC